jgi:hypothetical protein
MLSGMVSFILPESSTQYFLDRRLVGPDAILDVTFKGNIFPLLGIKQKFKDYICIMK